MQLEKKVQKPDYILLERLESKILVSYIIYTNREAGTYQISRRNLCNLDSFRELMYDDVTVSKYGFMISQEDAGWSKWKSDVIDDMWSKIKLDENRQKE